MNPEKEHKLLWMSGDNPWTEFEDQVACLFVMATRRGCFKGKADEEVNAMMSALLSRRTPEACGERIDLFYQKPPYAISGEPIEWPEKKEPPRVSVRDFPFRPKSVWR